MKGFSNDCIIFNDPFRFSARNIEDIIHTVSEPATLKDTQGRGVLTNQYETKFSGFQPDEFVGCTIEDISERAKLLKGSKQTFIKKIKQIESEVTFSNRVRFLKEIYITYDGFIRVENLIKLPISGLNGKCIAIFSYSEDLTYHLNLFDLFLLYKKFYLPKEAIIQFLKYFDVKDYFQELPTRTEALVIIAMSIDHRHKECSKLLNQKLRTVAAHSFSLQQKLKPGISFTTILTRIRNAGKNTCSVKDWLTD